MFPFESIDAKDAYHVVLSLESVLVRLGRCVFLAVEHLCADGTRKGLGYAAAEELALVVASLEFLEPMERYGHQHIHRVEPMAGGYFLPEQRSIF